MKRAILAAAEEISVNAAVSSELDGIFTSEEEERKELKTFSVLFLTCFGKSLHKSGCTWWLTTGQ